MHKKNGWSVWDLISTLLCWSSGAEVCHEPLQPSPLLRVLQVSVASPCAYKQLRLSAVLSDAAPHAWA